MGLFHASWDALRSVVAGLSDDDLLRPSGCRGWLVRDLVCHLIIDAQDVLITLATPSHGTPTRNATTYWEISGTPPSGDDPLDALTVRLAAAYQDSWLLKFHLDDVGSAAGRAARLADPLARVGTKGEIIEVADYLDAYVVEWTLHHLDLIAHLPHVPGPPADSLAASREGLGGIVGGAFPDSFSDVDALLVGTGRRAPTEAEAGALVRNRLSAPVSLG
ncbi:maleylpyruvate isomerase N-terminal domain-containing protein [Saccharopolyspora dendranthemae]|uniref:Mycothiol maleylpyruvate isomerase-like protein n=1 Tax=Saccharopolyspora dendranthemae TaxID=1181886 RepID=A0A561V8R9_9PSEU|nr:maleylpyruvate isomerase N-terminal domain-containing protein [Saccharopolyspora dendranthemae]TWG08011.1 mycothiol maleylpyruvate isomerase-like protein [Saccharopolyspora dendranthemae]